MARRAVPGGRPNAEPGEGRASGTAQRCRLDEWLSRIEHSIKPSMAQDWRNYANYYVKPYIGERDVQDIDGAVCDALYAKLLAEGRIKAKPKTAPTKQPVHVRRVSESGNAQPCRPYRYDALRCYRTHAEDDPLLGRPIESAKPVRQSARIHHAFRARAAKSGRSASYRRSCNARVTIGSSRCGCSKRPLACGVANWRAPGATCSTSTPERSRLNRRASSTAR
jgi:integrase-like protein